MSYPNQPYEMLQAINGVFYKKYIREACDINFCRKKAVASCYICQNRLCQKHNVYRHGAHSYCVKCYEF